MSKAFDFWDKVFDGLDEKYVNEAAERLHAYPLIEADDAELITAAKTKTPKWKNIMATAAAVVIGVGIVGSATALLSGKIPTLQEQAQSTGSIEWITVSRGRNSEPVKIMPDAKTPYYAYFDRATEIIRFADSSEYCEAEFSPDEFEEYYEISAQIDGKEVKFAFAENSAGEPYYISEGKVYGFATASSEKFAHIKEIILEVTGNITPTEYENDFPFGKIKTTPVIPAERKDSDTGIATYPSPEEYLLRFESFCNSGGIRRIGNSVLENYALDESKCFYEENGVNLVYKNDGKTLVLYATDTNNTPYEACMPDGRILEFAEKSEESEIVLRDGSTLKLKIGGMYYANDYYNVAKFRYNNKNFSIYGNRMLIRQFIEAVVTVTADVDGLSDTLTYYNFLPADPDKYTHDMSIFADKFCVDYTDGVNKLTFDYSSDYFSFSENKCIGFYTDENGAYMAGERGVWFRPADEGENKSLYYYDVSVYDGEKIALSGYNKKFSITGHPFHYTTAGRQGYIGTLLVCDTLGISIDDLYNTEITYKGEKWYTNGDESGDVYVSKFGGREITLHLDMKNRKGEHRYFSFEYYEDDEKWQLKDEHYPYDISVITHELYPTVLSESMQLASDSEEYKAGLRFRTAVDFYPLDDESYYAVRTLYYNMDQFANMKEIFYFENSPYDKKGYDFITDELSGYLGRLPIMLDDNKMYIIHAEYNDEGKEYYYATCIEGMNISATYDIGAVEGIPEKYSVTDGVVTITFDMYNDVAEKSVISVDFSDTRSPVSNEIFNHDLISELGMTYADLSEKYNSAPKGTYKGYNFGGYGLYGWKTSDGSVIEDINAAGGCNWIDGVGVSELFTGITYPISFDDLQNKYSFTADSIGTEKTMSDLYWSSFRHPSYKNVLFTFGTEEYGVIGGRTSTILQLDMDCREAERIAISATQ